MAPKLSYDQLQTYGWAIDPRTGVVWPGYVSLSLCLMIDGRRHVCVPGAGPTLDEAIRDAVIAANAWIQHQRPTHPVRRAIEDDRPIGR
jgi:hypothetical protein